MAACGGEKVCGLGRTWLDQFFSLVYLLASNMLVSALETKDLWEGRDKQVGVERAEVDGRFS